eukprot:15341822-Alexandrium_andersonii.AAC.1
MSASLVGSEMCIRDRTCGGRAPRGAGGAGVTSCVCATVERLCRERGEAVSYTHLTLPTICSV